MEIQVKTCPKCGRELAAAKFYRNSNTADGLSEICRSCSHAKTLNKERGGLNPALAQFTPRELIAELKARGYSGELQYTQTIKL